MKYTECWQQGLPITSSYVESAVKQFNQRVKGVEMFWSEEGAEAILQLRADRLSEKEPLTEFWQTRQAKQNARSGPVEHLSRFHGTAGYLDAPFPDAFVPCSSAAHGTDRPKSRKLGSP